MHARTRSLPAALPWIAALSLLLLAAPSGRAQAFFGGGLVPDSPATPRQLGAAHVPVGVVPTEHELTVFTVRSSGSIDWSSPGSLFSTYLASAARSDLDGGLDMGHLFVRLRTTRFPEGVWAGMSDVDPREGRKLLLDHAYGFGVLAANMAGRLDRQDEGDEEVRKHRAGGNLAFMRFVISPETGERLAGFFTEYRDRGYGENYGGANRPRYRGEGGGCGQFAAAFVELAGLTEHAGVDAWTKDIRIPKALFGGPLFRQEIGFWSMARGVLFGGWAKPGEPGVDARIYDPSMAHSWIRATREAAEAGAGPRAWKAEALPSGAEGISLDVRDVPTPSDPIFRDPQEPHPYGRQPGLRGVAANVP